MNSIIELDPGCYRRHAIHSDGRCWAETNCYVDVVVELIHSLGFEPVAALAFTTSIDFEVDQWTFFKFLHHDLLEMFGIDVQELNPWRSLSQHVEEQVNNGRPVLVEMDSYFLPDTAGSAYKLQHVKSTIAINEIDVEREHMGYFHGQGYYHLQGDDFRHIFQLDGLVHERMLPPYIELVKLWKAPAGIRTDELLMQSVASLKRQLALLPGANPFSAFKTRFQQDLAWLMHEPIESFHAYSFATLRQYGACFELVETYLRWLSDHGQSGLVESAEAFRQLSALAKTFQFKLARAITRKTTLDLEPIDQMSDLWQRGADLLTDRYL